MSFGFALVLPDGVFILADGRQVKPLAENEIVSDDIDKIQIIESKFAMVPFGFTVATDYAILIVRAGWPTPARQKGVCQLVKNAVEIGWNNAVRRLAPDVDKTDPSLRCALLGGGILGSKPFITGVLVGFTSNDERTMDQALNYIALGGEKYKSSGRTKQDIQRAFTKYRYDINSGPCNSTIDEIVLLVSATVVSLSSQDCSIGGRIRYAIFRDRYPAYKACVSQ